MPSEKITSFRDLGVFQGTYAAMLVVMKTIVPSLPRSEKFDLSDQISRSCKAIPRLIAEGYAKRHQKAGFQKYIDDAMAECNETIVSLNQCKDIYPEVMDIDLCRKLIDDYDKAGRQLYKLGQAWNTNKKTTHTSGKHQSL